MIDSNNFEKYTTLQHIYFDIKQLEFSEDNIVELIGFFNQTYRIAEQLDNKLLIQELGRTKRKNIDDVFSPDADPKYFLSQFEELKSEIKADLRRHGGCLDYPIEP